MKILTENESYGEDEETGGWEQVQKWIIGIYNSPIYRIQTSRYITLGSE